MNPPEEYRCPISLELMADPVVLSTGQSYDRSSIQQWLDAGHRTCPKTKQPLCDARLIPNYALRALIHSWAAQHGVSLGASGGAASRPVAAPPAAAAAAVDKRRVERLVKELRSSDGAAVRNSIRELRTVAKEGKEARAAVCEAGAVAAIRAVLLVAAEGRWPAALTAQVEENAVVALLNLAADDEHKVGIVAEGGVDGLATALSRCGSSRDTKASAALTSTSLAMVDVNKATLGRRPGLPAALVGVVANGSARGRKDAAIALYSLCLLPENRPRVVAAGAVPILVASLHDSGSGSGSDQQQQEEATERSLALLDALSACTQGRDAIRRYCTAALLVAPLAAGRSERCRESGAAVLAAVCDGDASWAAAARRAGALGHLADVAATLAEGSRARRKAAKLAAILSST